MKFLENFIPLLRNATFRCDFMAKIPKDADKQKSMGRARVTYFQERKEHFLRVLQQDLFAKSETTTKETNHNNIMASVPLFPLTSELLLNLCHAPRLTQTCECATFSKNGAFKLCFTEVYNSENSHLFCFHGKCNQCFQKMPAEQF